MAKKNSQQPAKDTQILDETQMKWYIVQTYVGFEDAVARQLESKISNVGLQEKIKEIYVPIKKIMKLNRKGERQEKTEKVYPGYIYVQMILDRETGYIIQNTQYVSRIAGTGDFAVALEEGYIEKLKAQLQEESQQVKSQSSTTFILGDLVKVVDGPFKDMTGKVSGLDPQNSRINVLLTIFDRETDVELDVLQVQKLA